MRDLRNSPMWEKLSKLKVKHLLPFLWRRKSERGENYGGKSGIFGPFLRRGEFPKIPARSISFLGVEF